MAAHTVAAAVQSHENRLGAVCIATAALPVTSSAVVVFLIFNLSTVLRSTPALERRCLL